MELNNFYIVDEFYILKKDLNYYLIIFKYYFVNYIILIYFL